MSRITRPTGADRRVRKTRDRLGGALVELIREKRFDAITVGEVTGRAGVGRSTFYAHFRDKEDLFLREIDEGLQVMASNLSRSREASDRVAPVREFFAHVAEHRDLRHAFEASGKMHDFLDLAHARFASAIERRLAEVPRGRCIPESSRGFVAHAHAGALLSLLLWWLDQPKPMPPERMDEAFHRMVWNGLGPVQGKRWGHGVAGQL